MSRIQRAAEWALTKLASGFDAGSTTISRIRGWTPSNREITSLIVGDGQLMRARARKLERENPWAKGAVDTDVGNIIGTGITPRSAHPDVNTRNAIDAAWKRDQRLMDADGRCDLYGLQKIICRRVRVDGEVFIRIRLRRPTDPVLVQFQLLEADFCPYFKTELAPKDIRAGIEFDMIGRRIAYWMLKYHPGAQWMVDASLYRIPAEQIIHVYEIDRPGQLRGSSWLVPAMVMLYDIKQLLDAALLRQKISNLLSVWIKKAPSSGRILGETPTTNAQGRNVGGATADLQPGAVNYLQENEEPTFLTPTEQGIEFNAFMNTLLRAVARALNMSFEQLSGDLSGTNFSSIKVGVLEYRRVREAFQYLTMIVQCCDPIWSVWMDQQLLSGRFGPKAIIDAQKNPESYRAIWDPPGWPWINEEDVKTAKASVRCGFSTRASVIAGTGENPEKIDNENAADNKRADTLGLIFDSDGRQLDGGQKAALHEPGPGAPPVPAPQPTQSAPKK